MPCAAYHMRSFPCAPLAIGTGRAPPLQGHRKPSPQAYTSCVDTLGVAPADLLFVDDRQPNIDGALAAGLGAILFKGAGPLEDELKARGLQF